MPPSRRCGLARPLSNGALGKREGTAGGKRGTSTDDGAHPPLVRLSYSPACRRAAFRPVPKRRAVGHREMFDGEGVRFNFPHSGLVPESSDLTSFTSGTRLSAQGLGLAGFRHRAGMRARIVRSAERFGLVQLLAYATRLRHPQPSRRISGSRVPFHAKVMVRPWRMFWMTAGRKTAMHSPWAWRAEG